MDMTTLKSLVIELKDSGMTFQEVSDTLKEKYGVIRTRQAVSGLYNRAKESLGDEQNKQLLTSDVINFYCICDNASQVYEVMHNLGYNISYRSVLNTINSEDKYIESVKQTIVANLVTKLHNLTDIRDARNSIVYKGTLVSTKRFREYIEEAGRVFIRQHITSDLNKLYQLTSDKGMVKQLAESFNIAIKTSDLRI